MRIAGRLGGATAAAAVTALTIPAMFWAIVSSTYGPLWGP